MSYLLPMLTAVWLGILTSISPCPLATNIAAVSYLSKRIVSLKAVCISSLAYVAGRMTAYSFLGILILKSLFSTPATARFLQDYMNLFLGPILILVGLFLIGIIPLSFSGFTIAKEKQERLAQSGILGSFLLGLIFALSFCPISAALFFGSLLPLAVNSKGGIALPLLYGFGTALPVTVFAIGIAFSIEKIQAWFHRAKKIEQFTTRLTGFIFIGAGLYYTWMYIIVRFVMN